MRHFKAGRIWKRYIWGQFDNGLVRMRCKHLIFIYSSRKNLIHYENNSQYKPIDNVNYIYHRYKTQFQERLITWYGSQIKRINLIHFKFILTNNKNNIILSNKLKIRSQIDPSLSFNIKTNFQLLVLPKKK